MRGAGQNAAVPIPSTPHPPAIIHLSREEGRQIALRPPPAVLANHPCLAPLAPCAPRWCHDGLVSDTHPTGLDAAPSEFKTLLRH